MFVIEVSVDTRGRIYIPVRLRDVLDLSPGDWLEIRYDGYRSFGRVRNNHFIVDELTRKMIPSGESIRIKLKKYNHRTGK